MSSPKFKVGEEVILVAAGVGKEASPRKKHQKGDMSFKNLMETLKFPEEISQC